MARALLGVAAALLLAGSPAPAQEWPAKPIHVVVPFTPGGVSEAIFRSMSGRIEEKLGQRFVLENKPGADAVIGTSYVVRSAADGYTMLLASTSVMVVKQHMFKNLGFDPLTALAPVSMLADAPLIAVVAPGMQAKSLQDVADTLRANPGKYNYGSPGQGSPTHLTGAFLSQQTGNSMVYVPYKGTQPLVQALLASDIHIAFPTLTAVAGQLKAGKLRVVAVMSKQRLPELPDIPTAVEAGFPQLVAGNWWALVTPRDTPAPIVARLGGEIRAALADAEVRKRLAGVGQIPIELSPADTRAFLAAESARYKTIVDTGGIKAE
jgi:tripartite-type tricarboxylate transporter receptor subunit TctC